MSITSAIFTKCGEFFIGKNDEDALRTFELAIKYNPHAVKAYIGAFAVMCRLGRLEEGLAILDQAIKANPEKTKETDEIREIRDAMRTIHEGKPPSPQNQQKTAQGDSRRIRKKILDQNLIFDIFSIGGGRFEFTFESTLTGERRNIKNGSVSAADVKRLVLGFQNLPKNCEFHQAVAIIERVELHREEGGPTGPITQGGTLEDGSGDSEEIRLEDSPF
jgi:tetratricopeptide (TPR) repeat protein